MKFILTFLLLAPFSALSTQIDQRLQAYIQEFHLGTLPGPGPVNKKLFNLGRLLFMDRALSGNNNISCADCHHPLAMTHDRLPLGIGEGAKGIQTDLSHRVQAKGRILSRNTPALFNLFGVEVMFWDARVAYGPITETIFAPIELRKDIADKIKSAVALQAIFPIVDHAEMRGEPGSNSIADAKDEHETWDLVVKKLLEIKTFKDAFDAAYPEETINIGHVGEALAEFQTQAFHFSDTPYDRYLKGEIKAMTHIQKKGMDVFFNKARCGTCHDGPHLSNFGLHNVAAPQIGPGKENGDDLGFYHITNHTGTYAFRVPPLRNVAVTAPYFHSGAYNSLEEVVDHYNNPEQALKNYVLKKHWDNYLEPLSGHDHSKDKTKLATLSPMLPRKLGLDESEKTALLEFLSTALTDKRLLP